MQYHIIDFSSSSYNHVVLLNDLFYDFPEKKKTIDAINSINTQRKEPAACKDPVPFTVYSGMNKIKKRICFRTLRHSFALGHGIVHVESCFLGHPNVHCKVGWPPKNENSVIAGKHSIAWRLSLE